MSDEADIAATIVDETIARGLARVAADIPQGVAGECDECGEDMPRLVEGRCGFCRDGRRPPLSFYESARSIRREAPAIVARVAAPPNPDGRTQVAPIAVPPPIEAAASNPPSCPIEEPAVMPQAPSNPQSNAPASKPTKRGALLAWLTEAAERGDRCPSLVEAKQRLKMGELGVKKLFSELHEDGAIRIEGTPRTRVITIVATGKSTARMAEAPSAAPAAATGTVDAVAGNDGLAEGSRAFATVTNRIASLLPQSQAPSLGGVTPTDPPVARGLAGLKADVEFVDGELQLSVWLSTDPGPLREFRRFLTLPLDEAHATELLGTTAIALRDARLAREQAA